MADHQTYVHGSEREAWWWGCSTCSDFPPNQWTFRHDAELAAKRHITEHATDHKGQ